MKLVFIVCVLFCSCYSMSDRQLQAAVKLIRNVCQPKLKLTNEDITNIHKGVYDRPDYKCYMDCVVRMGQILKDGKFDYDNCVKQVSVIDNVQVREMGLGAAANCKNIVKSAEKCEGGFELYSCLALFSKEYFFLP